MAWVTKTAAVETTAAIWEYDPEDPDNRIMGGTALDAVAIIRTLAVKVCHSFYTHLRPSGLRLTLFSLAVRSKHLDSVSNTSGCSRQKLASRLMTILSFLSTVIHVGEQRLGCARGHTNCVRYVDVCYLPGMT